MARIAKNRAKDRPGQQRGDRWLRDFVPYQLYRITNQLNRRLRRRLRRSHINIGRWRVLGVLKAHGEQTMSEVVERTVMEQPTASRIVAQLVKEGLVDREMSQQDSRFVHVKLTKAGEAAFREIYPIAVEHQTRALRDFSKAEIATLMEFLERIQHNVEAED